MGVTKAIASTERSVPGRWHELFDTIRVSSQTAHLKLIEIDEDVASEFYDMEEEFKRRIGRGQLYRKKDIEMAQERIDKINFKQTHSNRRHL